MKTTDTTQPTPRSSTPNPAWTPGPDEIAAYQLGIAEAHQSCGMTYDDDPESPRSVAYDWGRNVGEIDATGPANWKALLAAAPEMAEALRNAERTLGDCRRILDPNASARIAMLVRNVDAELTKARALLARINGEGGGK